MATETELYRIIVETQGGRELLTLNRNIFNMNKEMRVFNRETRQYTTSSKRMVTANRNMSYSFQNASFQIQDFINQVSFGTSPVRAFAIQGPAIASGFGPIPAVLATVASAVLIAADSFIDFGNGAEKAKNAIGNLRSSSDAYQQTLRGVYASQEEITKNFGSAQEEAAIVRRLKLRIEEVEAMQSLQAAAKESISAFNALDDSGRSRDFNEVLQERNELLADMRGLQQTLRETAGTTESLIPSFALRNTKENLAAVNQELQEFTDSIGTSEEQATFLYNSLERLGQAKSPIQFAEAAAEFAENFQKSNIELQNLDPELRRVLEIVISVGEEAALIQGAFENATGAAQGLNTALQQSVSAVRQLSASTASIGFSNIQRAAQLQALEAGATVEAARLAGEIEGKRVELEALLYNSDSAIRTAARRELDSFIAAKNQELTLNQQILAIERERARLQSGVGTGGGGGGAAGGGQSIVNQIHTEVQAYNLLVDNLEKTSVAQSSAAQEAANLGQALQIVGQSTQLSGQLMAKYPDYIQQTQQALNKLNGELVITSEEFQNMLDSGFDVFFDEMITGSGDVKDAFKAMTKSILSDLGDIIAKWASNQIVRAIFGGGGAGVGASPFSAGASPFNAGVSAASSPLRLSRVSPSVATLNASSSTSVPATSAASSVIGKPITSSSASRSGGGVSFSPNISVVNNTPMQVSTQEDQLGNVTFTIDDVRKTIASDIINGGNNVAASIERTYRMSRGR